MTKSRIIFFIILICIILYFIKVKQKEKYKIEIYDLNNLYDDSEVAPRIIPIRHELNDLDYIINNKDINISLESMRMKKSMFTYIKRIKLTKKIRAVS